MKSPYGSPAEFLRSYLVRKQKGNPRYSLRAFARDIKVSPSFVTAMLKYQKPIPLEKVTVIGRTLEMDAYAVQNLKMLISLAQMRDPSALREISRIAAAEFSNYKPINKKNVNILTNWYYVAVLDLLACKNASADPSKIAMRLGISINQAKDALHFLIMNGFAKQVGSKLTKSNLKIRIPATESQKIIRDFHSQMIDKAKGHLLAKTDQQSYDARLITGITIPSNPEKIKKAQRMINEALHSIAAVLEDGNEKEVYQLNVQLFPLSFPGQS